MGMGLYPKNKAVAALIWPALPLTLIGCSLLWRQSEFWTDSVNEQYEYNALAFGPLLMWVTCLLGVHFRAQEEKGRALIFTIISAGLFSHVLVGNKYTSLAFANYVRLLLQQDVLLQDEGPAKETLGGLVLLYVATCLEFLSTSVPLGPTRKRQFVPVTICVVVAGLLAFVGAVVSLQTVAVSLKAVDPTNPTQGLYGAVFDIAMIGIVVFLLFLLGALLDTTEIVAAAVINAAGTGLWLLGTLLEVQDSREDLAAANIIGSGDRVDVYTGGVLSWLSCVVSLGGGIAFIYLQAGTMGIEA